MYEDKRIYIVVKTYPTISREYSELVCTAGITEEGDWIRLYPIPFRKLDYYQRFPKYTWINVRVKRNTGDFRPESYRPDLDSIKVEPRINNKPDWEERKRILFKTQTIYVSREEIIKKAKQKLMSLAFFKPAKILDLVAEPIERDWDAEKIAILKELSKQQNLFQTPEEIEEEYRTVKKVPYKFSYVFEDCNGIQSKLMIEDWEIGMLYFNCLKSARGNEKAAIEKVRKKFLDDFLNKDLYFCLGTTKAHHLIAKNPFIIIGVFYPPKTSEDYQLSLFDF